MTDPAVIERLEQVVGRVGLPLGIPDGAAPNDIMTYLASDKKVRHGRIRFVLLSRIGEVHVSDGSWSRPVDADTVSDLVNASRKRFLLKG